MMNFFNRVGIWLSDTFNWRGEEPEDDGLEEESDIDEEKIEKLIQRSADVYKSSKDKALTKDDYNEIENKIEESAKEYSKKIDRHVSRILEQLEHLQGLDKLEEVGFIRGYNTKINEEKARYEVHVIFQNGHEMTISLKNGMMKIESELAEENVHESSESVK